MSRIHSLLIRDIPEGSMLPMPIDATSAPGLPTRGEELRALFELFGTKPPGLPDGLHMVGQLRRLAEAVGLDPDPGFDLEAYLAALRVRLYGPQEGGEAASGGVDPASGSDAGADAGAAPAEGEEAIRSWEAACPAPVDSDIPSVAALRDRLEEALLHPDDAECAERLNATSREFGLFPGVDGEGRPRVLAAADDFASRLAAVLVPAAMSLAMPDRRRRIRTCTDRDCRSLFLDRSRDGRGRHCSPKCSDRVRTRARRGDCVANVPDQTGTTAGR
jgi:predicted RNA-binding Zn ribbon-like protein